MPTDNRFRHQSYRSTPPTAPYELVQPEPPEREGSDEYQQCMQQVGDAYRAAGVSTIYLVHGTFAGTDASGLLAEVERLLPEFAANARRQVKRAIDSVAGDAGNYTPEYAHQLQNAISRHGQDPISVKTFHWSGENQHLSRADAAVRLIDELAAQARPPRTRVLLWGHSHAGNVFALVTNLLASDLRLRQRFFDAAQGYYRRRFLRSRGDPVWQRTERLLQRTGNPLAQVALDLVTFGTPVRYGWDTAGYSQLLHFVYHRPQVGQPDYRASFPPSVDDLLHARSGDVVQQLGIAGTNFLANALTWRAWRVDRRLKNLLQSGVRNRDVLTNLKAAMRVPDEGTTLLVDYGHADDPRAQHLAGHAIYTRHAWMAFHAREIARRFYG